jgi:hypothetical protein
MEPDPCAGHESGPARRLLVVEQLLPLPYGELDTLRFKAELEEAQRELEDVSKKTGIAELEWEDQRKQLLATIDGISLRLTSSSIQLLILTIIALQLCSPRHRA